MLRGSYGMSERAVVRFAGRQRMANRHVNVVAPGAVTSGCVHSNHVRDITTLRPESGSSRSIQATKTRDELFALQQSKQKWQEFAGASASLSAASLGAVAGTLALFGGGYYIVCQTQGTADPVPNCAFVFIKPHANTPKGRDVVKATLQAKGLKVTGEGMIPGTEIEQKQLIDNHYYAIASKATLLPPEELNVPQPMFKAKFGIEWKDALAQKKVYNAKQACAKLKMDSSQLNAVWAKAKNANKLVKFGGGFYCGLIDTIPGEEPIYVMNGFFMSMRQNFVDPKASIYYYTVEWDGDKLHWEDFRGKVLGPTDPKDAPSDSLRGMFLQNWQSYGLASTPNVGDNAVHASASPFESLAERMNWLGVNPSNDAFGKLVLRQIGSKTLNEWKVDPQVTYGMISMKKSVFDSLEDTNSDYCLALLGMLYAQKK